MEERQGMEFWILKCPSNGGRESDGKSSTGYGLDIGKDFFPANNVDTTAWEQECGKSPMQGSSAYPSTIWPGTRGKGK